MKIVEIYKKNCNELAVIYDLYLIDYTIKKVYVNRYTNLINNFTQ